jgi:Tol biopolymer transport system component
MIPTVRPATSTDQPISNEAIRIQLEKILASQGFVHSDRMSRFLRFVVEQTIQGQADQIKESVIGMEVFDKTPSFDPRTDTIVRVEARRLRSKLSQYYAKEGLADPVVIDFPKGSYVPVFLGRLKEGPETRHEGELPPGAPAASQRITQGGYRSRFIWAAMAIGIVLAAAGAALWWTRTRAPNSQPMLKRLTSDTRLTYQPALSPDGKLVAYASDRGGEGNLDIWVKQIAGGEPLQLTHHEADDSEPSFSPDGSKIAFHSDRDGGGIWVISAMGGGERLVARRGRRPRFSPDGEQLAYFFHSPSSGIQDSKIYVVASTGGQPRQLQPGFGYAAWPVWSPDGKHLLFEGSRETPPLIPSGKPYEWWVTPIDGGTALQIGESGSFRRQNVSSHPSSWVTGPRGDAVIFSDGSQDTSNLWRVSISPRTWQVTGEPERLTFGTGLEVDPSSAGDGQIVFASLIANYDVWSLPIDANRAKAQGVPVRVVESAALDVHPSLSADGKKLVFNSTRSGQPDVWIKNMMTGKETALTDDLLKKDRTLLSPDGSKVAFQTLEGGNINYYIMDSSGGPARKICENCGGSLLGWLANGREILYYWGRPIRFGLINVDSGERQLVLQHPKYELHRGQVAPDERWIAFHVPMSQTRSSVFIVPLRRGGTPESDWITVTDGAGIDCWPLWSPDGSFLYFVSHRDGFRCIWGQQLDSATKRPVGAPRDVYCFHNARRSLFNLSNSGHLGLSLARDRLVFSTGEITGNIWMAEFGSE